MDWFIVFQPLCNLWTFRIRTNGHKIQAGSDRACEPDGEQIEPALKKCFRRRSVFFLIHWIQDQKGQELKQGTRCGRGLETRGLAKKVSFVYHDGYMF